MNATFEHCGNRLRLTRFVTLLALVSVILMAGCHSHAVARVAAASTPVGSSQAVPALPNPPEAMEPVQPFDEKPVTTMETVGASNKD